MDKRVLEQVIPITQPYKINILDTQASIEYLMGELQTKVIDISGNGFTSDTYQVQPFPSLETLTYRELVEFLGTLLNLTGIAAQRALTNEYVFENGDTFSDIIYQLQDKTQDLIEDIQEGIIDKYKELYDVDEDNDVIKAVRENIAHPLEWFDIKDISNDLMDEQVKVYDELRDAFEDFQIAMEENRERFTQIIGQIYDISIDETLTWEEIFDRILDFPIKENVIINGSIVVINGNNIKTIGGTINE